MKRILIILLFAALLPAGRLAAQESQETEQSTATESRKSGGILTGYSGGVAVHLGYLFSQSPDELFRNGSLKDNFSGLKDLPSDGATIGISGMLRLHLINHIHLGAEGGVSTMPLMRSGSQMRTGWGAALCDIYWKLGKVVPMIGLTIGGGETKRLYVPSGAEQVKNNEEVVYNASYTKTPFFLLDPYFGVEFLLTSRIALTLKLDYMLPFGSAGNGIKLNETVQWSNFVRPSGPRLHVGIAFGKY